MTEGEANYSVASESAEREAVGNEPGGSSSKLVVPLVAASPADEAVRTALRPLLETILVNRAGARENLDTEFLHDLRVAVRRTRSALGQLRGVFPAEDVEPFRKGLAWLGSLTGPTRDLDVYLLELPDYRRGLPRELRGGLEPLRAHLERRHRVEQRKLARGLDSARFRRLVDGWAAYLESGPEADRRTGAGQRPMSEIAARAIGRAHGRVLGKGRQIEDDSPIEALHRLRIDCKKLRYLMELFRSLYPQSEIEALIGKLKRLQDNLGDLNDYGVQREMLTRFAREMDEEGDAPPETLMAMGRLVARLEEGAERERSRFAERFAGFGSEKTTVRFERLYRSGDV